MGTAHGSGLMLLPALLPLCMTDGPARAITATGSFALMLADALEGVAHPPVGARPAAIGLRQLGASAAFAALMIAAYLAS